MIGGGGDERGERDVKEKERERVSSGIKRHPVRRRFNPVSTTSKLSREQRESSERAAIKTDKRRRVAPKRE